jgi:hypothetical protein
LHRDELELFAMIARRIWERRNGVVYGEPFTHPCVVVRQAMDHLQLHRKMNEKHQEVTEPPLLTIQRWEAPLSQYFKVNWDVAISYGEKRMGVGVIIRDGMGHVIVALSQPILALHETTTTEAMAALRAVEFCREVGINDILLEGDSLLVVKAVSGS